MIQLGLQKYWCLCHFEISISQVTQPLSDDVLSEADKFRSTTAKCSCLSGPATFRKICVWKPITYIRDQIKFYAIRKSPALLGSIRVPGVLSLSGFWGSTLFESEFCVSVSNVIFPGSCTPDRLPSTLIFPGKFLTSPSWDSSVILPGKLFTSPSLDSSVIFPGRAVVVVSDSTKRKISLKLLSLKLTFQGRNLPAADRRSSTEVSLFLQSRLVLQSKQDL